MEGCTCDFVVKELKSSDHYENCYLKLKAREEKGEFLHGIPRLPNGTIRLPNKHLIEVSEDYLYHLSLGISTHDLPAMFGDVKFVCMGGTTSRMKEFATVVAHEIGCKIPVGCDLIDITENSLRYSMFKVGPVLAVNHGIGISTLSVVLQEVIKLLAYSGAKDPIIFRIGTSGGIDIEPGSVVVSNKGYNGMLTSTYDLPILGKLVSMPVVLDQRLVQELIYLSKNNDFKTLAGGTMSSNDFYNGQGRTDGPFCEYEPEDKFEFLNRLKRLGIKNIEMEIACFGALTYKAGIRAADVCVTLLDRLHGDQIKLSKEEKMKIERRPMLVVIKYIQEYLKKNGQLPYTKT